VVHGVNAINWSLDPGPQPARGYLLQCKGRCMQHVLIGFSEAFVLLGHSHWDKLLQCSGG
jgi:hypothetical protein